MSSRRRNGKVPLLVSALAIQAMGQAFAATLSAPIGAWQGFEVRHNGKGLFRGMNQDLTVTRYHSLVVERGSFPPA